MSTIAFFTENSSISYAAIYVALGALAAFLCSSIAAVALKRRAVSVMACGAFSMLLAPVLARLVYWYCRPEQFEGIASAFTDMNRGGYSMVGVLLGVLLSACIVRLLRMTDNLASLLDGLSVGAPLGIAIGRLGGLYTSDDKGNYIFTDTAYHGIPWSVQVQNTVADSVEWRFATFFWESIAGFVIFVILFLMLVLRAESESGRPGGLFMAFLSLYGATQAMLESTRYDALHMRSNGFVSMMQMAALIMLLVPLLYYSVKTVGATRSGKGVVLCDLIALVTLGGAGVAEYYVQRKANYAMTIYPIQLVLLLTASVVTLILAARYERVSAEKENQPQS